MTKKEKGLLMLRWWYDASALHLRGVTFDQAVDFLVNKSEPRRLYLEIFGDDYDIVGADKAADAMYTLGELNQGKIPDPQYFMQILHDAVDPNKLTNFVPLVFGAVKDSAVEATKAVSDYGLFGIKSLYWIALAGVAVYVLTAARRRAA